MTLPNEVFHALKYRCPVCHTPAELMPNTAKPYTTPECSNCGALTRVEE